MTGTASLTIDLAELVWRTRGYDWDYAFIQAPSTARTHALTDRWFNLIEQAYPYLASHQPDDPVAGRIDGKLPFVATRVVDAEIADRFRRPVRHYFLISHVSAESLHASPAAWGSLLLARLKALLDVSGLLATDGPEALRAALEAVPLAQRIVTLTAPAVVPEPRHAGRRRVPTPVIVGALVITAAVSVLIARASRSLSRAATSPAATSPPATSPPATAPADGSAIAR